MKTREQIEAKIKEIFGEEIKTMAQAEHLTWDDETLSELSRYVAVLNAVRFIDFLTGDDQRERWECTETKCRKTVCVNLCEKGSHPPLRCTYDAQPCEWRKVGTK